MACREDVVRRRQLAGFQHNNVMLPADAVKTNLDKIARQRFIKRLEAAVGPCALIGREEAREILDACPGGRTVVQRAIIPAVVRGKVHDAGAGVKDLGGEVGAVP